VDFLIIDTCNLARFQAFSLNVNLSAVTWVVFCMIHLKCILDVLPKIIMQTFLLIYLNLIQIVYKTLNYNSQILMFLDQKLFFNIKYICFSNKT